MKIAVARGRNVEAGATLLVIDNPELVSELQAGLDESVMVVFQSDSYSTREWCKREVIWAKQLGCPVVVVPDAARSHRPTPE